MSRVVRGIEMSLGLLWVLVSVSVPVGLVITLAGSHPWFPRSLTVLGDPWYVLVALTISAMAVKIVAPMAARRHWRSNRAGAVSFGLLAWLGLFGSVLIMNWVAPQVVPQFLEPPLNKMMPTLWLVIEVGALLWSLALTPAAWRHERPRITSSAITRAPSSLSDPLSGDRWSPPALRDPKAELLALLVQLAASGPGQIDRDTSVTSSGEIITSQGALARRLGWSKGRLSYHLHALAAEGAIILDTSTNQTRIRVVTGA
jgi:hypothetical protein